MYLYKNIVKAISISLPLVLSLHGAEIEHSKNFDLITACRNPNAEAVETVKRLLAEKADANFANISGETPLVVIMEDLLPSNEEHLSCLTLLLDNGADVARPLTFRSFSLASYKSPLDGYHEPTIYHYLRREHVCKQDPTKQDFILSTLDQHQAKLNSLVHGIINERGYFFSSDLATIIVQYITREIPKESPLVYAILTYREESVRQLIAQGDGDKPLVVSNDIATDDTTTYENLTDFMKHNAAFREIDSDEKGKLSKLLHSLMAEHTAEKERALTVVKE